MPYYIQRKLSGIFKSKSSKDMSNSLTKRGDISESVAFEIHTIDSEFRSLANLTRMTSLSAPVSLARLVELDDGGIWKGPEKCNNNNI